MHLDIVKNTNDWANLPHNETQSASKCCLALKLAFEIKSNEN